MHFAVHGNTAAEVIFNRVDSEKQNIGLTNFKGAMPTQEYDKYMQNPVLPPNPKDLMNINVKI